MRTTSQAIKEKVMVVEQAIFQCSYPNCSKMFKTKFALKRHCLTHTSERAFKCNLCGKPFTLPQYLREHINTHTKDKPYVCGVAGCQERFRQAGKLSIHRRSHPEYTVKKYKYTLNPKKKKVVEDINNLDLLKNDLNCEKSSEDKLLSMSNTGNVGCASKTLPPISLLLPLNSYHESRKEKLALICNNIKILLKFQAPPHSFPMMQCLPWLTLPYNGFLFHPVLPLPNENCNNIKDISEALPAEGQMNQIGICKTEKDVSITNPFNFNI